MDPISIIVVLGICIAASALVILLIKLIIIWVETCQRDRRHRNGIWSQDEDRYRLSSEELPQCYTVISKEELNDIMKQQDCDLSECVICLDNFVSSSSDHVVKLKACHHYFHEKCINEWLIRNPRCPMCKECITNYKDSSSSSSSEGHPTSASRDSALLFSHSHQSHDPSSPSNISLSSLPSDATTVSVPYPYNYGPLFSSNPNSGSLDHPPSISHSESHPHSSSSTHQDGDVLIQTSSSSSSSNLFLNRANGLSSNNMSLAHDISIPSMVQSTASI